VAEVIDFIYNSVGSTLAQTVMVVISSAGLCKYCVLANLFSLNVSKFFTSSVGKRGLVF
jgi:hypothetical protein